MKQEEKKVAGLKYTGFKLISLELIDDKLFGDIKYDFIDTEDRQDQIYTSVLIGPNGTLKSRLFQKVILLFWNLHDLKNGKQILFHEKFALKYSLNNSIYEFSNMPKEGQDKKNFEIISLGFFIDGHEQRNSKDAPDFKKADLPSSIIASAIMLTDRFPFPDPEKFSIYQYLGSRYRPQLASTKTYIGRVVEFISKNIDSESFIAGIRKISQEFLQNSHSPCITFYTKNTSRFFNGNMEVEGFYSYYEEIDKKYKDKTTSPPFKLNHYKSKIKKEPQLAKEIVDYCNELKESGALRWFPRTSAKAISFNLIQQADVEKIRQKFSLLDHMRQLGIIYPAEIEFLKPVEKGDNTILDGYSIFESSSGEHNLIGSMIGLIASIKPDSLIFIDEPEISLHPNWQMKYLSFLRELLADKNYSTCHILVATHSHFLISDLDGQHSSVIALRRDSEKNKLVAELIGQDTFGWSPDDILYNVFGVASSRNKFVAEDIASILDTLSRGNKDQVNKIDHNVYEQLLHLNKSLKEGDPLKEVVKSIMKKVN